MSFELRASFYKKPGILALKLHTPESVFWAEIWDGSSDVIFGHTVVSLENIRDWDGVGTGRAYGIDTGAVFGGRLTAMILDPDHPRRRDIVQVAARREYFKLGEEM